jgi:hypothetical protein
VLLGLFRRKDIQSANPQLMGAAVSDQFLRDHATVAAWSELEHDDDGHHTNITAKSLTVDGNATVTGAMKSGTLTSPVTISTPPNQPQGTASIGVPVLGPGGRNIVDDPPSMGVEADVTLVGQSTDRDFLPSVDAQRNLGSLAGVGQPLQRRWKNVIVSNTLYGKSLWVEDRIYEKLNRAAGLGYWTAVPFNAANYSADPPLTWTVASGNQFRYAYTLIGKTMWLAVIIGGSTTAGGASGNGLRVTIPGGFLPAGNATVIGSGLNASASTLIVCGVVTGRSYVQVLPYPTTNPWNNGSCDAYFTIAFEIQ